MKTKLKWFIGGFLICFLLGANFGKCVCDYLQVYQYQELFSIAQPSVSASNSARLYMDNGNKALSVSINGGTFQPINNLGQLENFIDNPSGIVNQRQNSTTISTSFIYSYADRWKVKVSNGSATTSAFVPSTLFAMGGYMPFIYAETSSGTITFRQFIEKNNAYRLQNNTVNFSVKTSNNVDIGVTNLTGTLNIYPMTADDNGTAGSAMSTANLGVAQALNIASTTSINSGAVAFSSEPSHGLIVELQITFTGTNAGGGINVGDFQLQLGPFATPCRVRSYQEELFRCQRYFYVIRNDADTLDNTIWIGQCGGSGSGFVVAQVPVPLRKLPTLALTASQWSISDGTTTGALSALSIGDVNSVPYGNSISLSYTNTGTLATGRACRIWPNASSAAITFDADF